MRGRVSLLIKLSTAFVFVVVVAVVVVAYVAYRSTTSQFELYLHRGQMIRAEQWALALATFYVEQGSWAGAKALLLELTADGLGSPGRRRGQPESKARGQGGTDRVVLADPSGVVVADSDGELMGNRLSAEMLSNGASVQVKGQEVGIVLIGSPGADAGTLEAEYLRAINQAIFWAALISGSLALLLGVLLFRQLTRPLRGLTEAAQRIATGQRGTHVPIEANDEIGELAQAFNVMSEALKSDEELRRNLMVDIAHELRTPLTVIQGNAEALLDGLYETTPENIAVIHEQSLLLGRLVNDLRELALAEAGQLKLNVDNVDLGALVTAVLQGFKPKAQEKGVELRVGIPERIPLVFVDIQRIRQVLTNLIDNALRYTPPRGLVEVSAHSEGKNVFVHVRDTGIGISPEDLPHVFDRFYRVEKSRTRAEGGSGLGLAIAKQLVLAHGGDIRG